MGELLERMLSPPVLDEAWRRLRRDRAPWRPGLPREQMEAHWVRHLFELVEEVQRGDYRPEGLRRFSVRKPSGGLRVLSALSLRDKLLQTAALLVLTPQAERLFHPDSFAYRPGRSVEMALDRVRQRIGCGLDWVVDADIRHFFDEIPHGPLRRVLRRFIADRSVRELMAMWLEVGYAEGGLFGRRRGIPQGAVLSPLWCNLYLHQLDTAWHRRNLPFVRFADDFLLFSPNRDDAERAMAWTAQRLARLGLKLHPEKSRVTRVGPHVVFLGKPLPGRSQLK